MRPYWEKSCSMSFWPMVLGRPLTYRLASRIEAELGLAYDTCREKGTKPNSHVRNGEPTTRCLGQGSLANCHTVAKRRCVFFFKYPTFPLLHLALFPLSALISHSSVHHEPINTAPALAVQGLREARGIITECVCVCTRSLYSVCTISVYRHRKCG